MTGLDRKNASNLELNFLYLRDIRKLGPNEISKALNISIKSVDALLKTLDDCILA